MKITLGGKIGSGKSTVAKAIAKEFNLKHYSTGDLMRQLAKERGFTIEEFDKQTPEQIDHMVDDRTKKIGEMEDDFIFDSRLAFHFIPEAIKIFLEVSDQEAAKRIFKDQRESERKAENIQQLAERNRQRWADTSERFMKLYKIDLNDMNNYDIIIDTTNKRFEDVITEVKRAIQALQKT